jgi:hypothetical protein
MAVSDHDRGVLFVTTGPHYTAAAAAAARSVRRSNPNLAIGIFTDQTDVDPVFDFKGAILPGAERRKHEFLAQSPYSETLYLDSDVRVTACVSDFFDLLRRHDMAGAAVRYRALPHRQACWRHPVPVAFPQVNCGVLLYRRNEKVMEFMVKWSEAIKMGGFERDQLPFRETLWLSDLRFHTVGPEYNMRDINISPFSSKLPLPLILHIKAFHSRSRIRRLAAWLLMVPLRYRLRRAGHVI